MEQRPLVSVIIPVYNREKTIRECLRSIFRSVFERFEVIVIDDGSTDRTPEVVREFPVVSVGLKENRGAAFARNVGAREAEGDILFFLDSDIVIRTHTLKEIVDSFDARPGISALFCSYGKNTVPRNFFSVYKNLLHHYTHQISDENAATFCGGFGAIKRDVFFDIGGFDERYRYLEDMELGYRLFRSGFRIFLNNRIQVTHLKHYTLTGLIRSDLFERALPWTRIMLENGIWRNDLNTKTHNVLSVPVCFLMILSPAPVFQPLGGGYLFFAFTALFLVLNTPFFRFLCRERGPVFTIQAMGMHWFYYLYSGVGFVMGLWAFLVGRLRKKAYT